MPSATAQTRGTRNLPAEVEITVRDVRMSGPSFNAIQEACTQVMQGRTQQQTAISSTSAGETAGATTGVREGNRRQKMSPAARKKISEAVKARHAQAKKKQPEKAMAAGG
jgi:hypothetical protein